MKTADKEKKRKVYKRPELVSYGDVNTLTRNINGATGNTDSNPTGTKKTH